MSRLPAVDEFPWGEVLNDFLSVSHRSDGFLRMDVYSLSALSAFDVEKASAGTQVHVGGLTGGWFSYDPNSSLADDGWSVIAPTLGAGRWLRVYRGIDVRAFGAVGDGIVDDTVAIQRCLDLGGEVVFPKGIWRHGPVIVSVPTSIIHLPGSIVVPIFDVSTNEKLYSFSSKGSSIDGLTISNVIGTISQNKYIIYAGPGADRFTASNAVLTAISASDGISGSGNLKVIHGIYIENNSGANINRCRINAISGSAIFLNKSSNSVVHNNHITDTRWYSITADQSVDGCIISDNTIDGAGENTRYYGGSINLMSQLESPKNHRIIVRGNIITGVHNYGSVIRLLSIENCVVESNIVYDCSIGSLSAGGALQSIGLDRRGGVIQEGSIGNGPCKNVIIVNNTLQAGATPCQAIYIKNQGPYTRDPHQNIIVANNTILSESSSTAFECGVTIHGFYAGFDGVRVAGNLIQVQTVSGSTVGGAIGITATDAEGEVRGLSIEGNSIIDINTAVPSAAYQTGLYLLGYTPNARVRGNRLVNFFYGLRTAANIVSPMGLNDQDFVGCINNFLLSTAPVGGPFDMSLGTALPVTGVYRVGHVRQLTNAAASSSWGWIVTTAGGAMVAAWASGQTYASGAWYRNGAGKVYELITAGGGATSVQPTGGTVGSDEMGADGYVWRCRALTCARWAPLPALGAVEALP